MEKMTALYARISTSGGKQTTDSQLLEVENYCQMRGWTKVEVYSDKVSGAKSSRPALDRMMKDMRAGKIERVVAYKLDRIGRSLTHLCLMVDEMSNLNIPLICCSQGISTENNNPAGKFQLDVLKAVCEFERNLIRDRVNAGLAAFRKRHPDRALGRPATLHKHRDEVIGLRDKGMKLREIGRELNLPISSVFKILKTEGKQGN